MALILVVDDDPQVRELIREILESEGFDVDTAADGHQALEKVARRRPSLLVLDLTLPLMSGPELAARLQHHDHAPIPILVISGDGRAPSKAKQLGAYAYLHKPFQIDALLDSVMHGLRAS